MAEPQSREAQRDRLLEAALPHIPFEGWSRRALLAAAQDLGLEPSVVRRLFPRAGDDLLAQLDHWADRQMLARVDAAALGRLRTHERIATLAWARLEALLPHREALRRAVAARLLPANALAAGTNLWRTVDLIWAVAGDRAGDASYYTRRALLAAVWLATFLYWLDDRSPGAADSRAFLDRRLAGVLRFGRLRSQLGRWLPGGGRADPLAARR
jgi:ubiquinone biosynthesis protein COQ9